MAGASQGSPSRQIGFVGPRITTPRNPEAVPEAAAPASGEAVCAGATHAGWQTRIASFKLPGC